MAVQEFISPTSLSEAQQVVGDGAASSWLAGGTDLLACLSAIPRGCSIWAE